MISADKTVSIENATGNMQPCMSTRGIDPHQRGMDTRPIITPLGFRSYTKCFYMQ